MRVWIYKIIALSLLVLYSVSILTYNPKDPSFNTASTYSSYFNVLGPIGSYCADFFLQTFGLGTLIMPLVIVLIYANKTRKFSIANLRILLIASMMLMTLTTIYEEVRYNMGGIVGEIILKILRILGLPANLAMGIIILISATVMTAKELFALTTRKKSLDKDPNPSAFDIKTVHKNYAKISSPSSKNLAERAKTINFANQKRNLPNIDLLNHTTHNKSDENNEDNIFIKAKLEQTLRDFSIKGDIIEVTSGPVVTLYELLPIAGTKSSRVIGLAGDVARSMKVASARIATIPDKGTIGIELPNKIRRTVYLREIIEGMQKYPKDLKLPIALGKDIKGNPMIADLSNMPHLLIAGTTGSGKSVGLNAIIISLLYSLCPHECKFIMVDPKMLELSIYQDIPHLMTPVIIDPKKSINALKWLIKEMENRYRLMSQLSVRNIYGFNEKIKDAIAKDIALTRRVQSGFDSQTQRPVFETLPIKMQTLPFVVLVIDEMADLMLVAGKEFEHSVQRLAQMGRASGIHIIAATQRPSVDVITGVIKANFPNRISFAVTSKFDSRTIIGEQGAEQLLGMGDMLYMPSSSRLIRVHGPFVSDEEVQRIADFARSQGSPDYIDEIIEDDEAQDDFDTTNQNSAATDLYQQAIKIVREEQKVSTSYIQRRLQIGYNRAANLVEKMEQDGIVSAPSHSGKRHVIDD